MPQRDKTVHQKKTKITASTQRFLPIGEIRDNTLVLKNGGIRAILRTSSVNFNLKSSEEQNALIYAYQGFLNTISFPIQILIRSRKLDIDMYLDRLNALAKKQESPLMRKQTLEYMEYIKKLVEYADIMEKNFYVVIPYDPMRARDISLFKKFSRSITPDDSITNIRIRHREFDKLRKKLAQRVNIVRAGLEGCGLQVIELDTNRIVELFYQIYNPQTSRNQKISHLAGQDILPV
jgi:type IV secretory pathway VirB4 component